MRSWVIGVIALLCGSPAHSAVTPGWSIVPLPEGAELRYVPPVVGLRDYPKQALRAGDHGTTVLKLQVDSSGLIGCTTARSSGSPLLDEQSCRLYRERGRFDLRGTCGPVTLQAPVAWVLMD
jgi:TonB family protein